MALLLLRTGLCPAAAALPHPPTTATTVLLHLRRQPFSTTPSPHGRHSKSALQLIMRKLPPYPYPIRHTYKKSWFGLFDGKHIQFGNNVPDGEYTSSTKRTWKPNVKNKKLYSQAMKKFIRVPVVTSVLRTIDKCGGLDEYLLGTKPARLATLGPVGWKLRHILMRTKDVQKRFDEERVKLGLKRHGIQGVKGRGGLSRKSVRARAAERRGTGAVTSKSVLLASLARRGGKPAKVKITAAKPKKSKISTATSTPTPKSPTPMTKASVAQAARASVAKTIVARERQKET